MKKSIHNAYILYNVHEPINRWYIQHIIDAFQKHHVSMSLIFDNEYQKIDVDEHTLIMNRTRDYHIAKYFENKKAIVINNSYVCKLGNNKLYAYDELKPYGLPILNYMLYTKQHINHEMVIKSLDGHGGSEVDLVSNQEQIDKIIKSHPHKQFLLQEKLANSGIDVRVYILHNQIYRVVKRESRNGFKANFSLGGKVSLYDLLPHQIAMINKILAITHFDFVGIDFLVDKKENFYFNEIEDVVGSRMLYQISEDDIIQDFVDQLFI